MFGLPKLLILSAIMSVAVFVFLPQATMAKNYATDQGNIYVGSNEVVNNTFMDFGGTVDIRGAINGDVIVGGGNVTISGSVSGDVLSAGGNIKITGPVGGNVRVAGGTVEIDSKVGKNINVLAGTFVLGDKSEVGGNVLFGAGTANLSGKISGYVDGNSGNIDLAGEFNQDVNVTIDKNGQLVLSPNAMVKTNLKFSAAEESQLVKEGGVVQGQTTFNTITRQTQTAQKHWSGYFFWKLVSLFGILVVGLVLVSLHRKGVEKVVHQLINKPWSNLGWGVVYSIITPIILILLAATIIGIPLLLIGFAVYAILLYIGKIFVGLALGQILIGKIAKMSGKNKPVKKGKEASLIWPMILGLVVIVILISIPIIGWIIKLLVLWLGLGAIIESMKKSKATAAVA
jgi:hypothetical protein